jgi:hypothetical protein
MRILLSFLVLATVSIPAAPAAAQVPPTLTPETNIKVDQFSIAQSTTQAGAHPRVDIRMRFCNPGLDISNVTGAGQAIRITTAQDHGVTANNTLMRVLYVKGNTAANGSWRARLVFDPVTGAQIPNQLDVFQGATAVFGNGDYAGGGELYVNPSTVEGRNNFSCHTYVKAGVPGDSGRAYLRDFVLRLPPGFVGNPASVPQCPTHLWLAGSCPQNTQLGHVLAEAASAGAMIFVPTSVFNLQTMGLEPARLGTEAVPAFPPGPLPNTVTIRTTGDYGIDSSQIHNPKELGAAPGNVRNIQIVLCERVPCNEAIRSQPLTVAPIEPARPFFVNPTSCGTKMARLEARSWNPGDPGDFLEAPIQSTGCDDVPFEPTVSVTPKDQSPGASNE